MREGVKQTLQQVPRLQALDFMAGRARAIDLKLRLALRVAALAAVCFLAVAAYALFDSDRAARAKVGRIAEIVARDISLQQAQAHWFTLSSERTPDLQRVAAPLMEPSLIRTRSAPFGRVSAAARSPRKLPRPKVTQHSIAPFSIPANRSRSRCCSKARRREWRSRHSTPPCRSAKAGARPAACFPSWRSRWRDFALRSM